MVLQQWLTFGHVNEDKINTMLGLFSPYEERPARQYLMFIIQKAVMRVNGRVPNDFNGGYHTLASLYAALG